MSNFKLLGYLIAGVCGVLTTQYALAPELKRRQQEAFKQHHDQLLSEEAATSAVDDSAPSNITTLASVASPTTTEPLSDPISAPPASKLSAWLSDKLKPGDARKLKTSGNDAHILKDQLTPKD